MLEITSEEQNKVNRMKRTKDSLRDLWDNIKCTNIWIIGGPRRKRKKGRVWEHFWRDYSWKFPQHGKGSRQSSPTGRVPYRINPRRNTPRHILVKITKVKHKERILKAARDKQQVTTEGNHICLTADLSAETLQARGSDRIYLKYWKEKILQPRLLYPARVSFKIDGDSKAFQTSKS